jgi:sulfonate transport system substrate-binding protein
VIDCVGALGIITVVLSTLTGCGAGNRAQQPVRIAITRGSYVNLPIYVASSTGCFEKQGVVASVEEMDGASKSMQALLGGSIDVASGGYISLLDLMSQQRPLRGFVLMQRLPGFAAMVSPRASRPVRVIEDLKGRSIGVASIGNDYHRLLNYVLQQHGISPTDVNVIGVGPAMTHASALERGVVDVGVASGLTIHYLQRRDPSIRILFDTLTPESTKASLGFEEVPLTLLCARENWLRANISLARRLAAAIQCALSWTHTHTPQQIREILPASCRSPDAEADFDAIASTQRMLSVDGRMTHKSHEAAARIWSVLSQTKSDVLEAYTNEYLEAQ